MTEEYAGRQVVGMDLHRRRSVLVRMTEDGRKLGTARIGNSLAALRAKLARVVDCWPAKRRGPRDAARFEATGQARARVGWEYRLVGAAEKIVTANARWPGTGIPPSPAGAGGCAAAGVRQPGTVDGRGGGGG
jgi:hypothetical protein